jgi:hypothetical protein
MHLEGLSNEISSALNEARGRGATKSLYAMFAAPTLLVTKSFVPRIS